MGDDNIATLAREIASALAALPGVLAVARSGRRIGRSIGRRGRGAIG